MPAGHYLKRLDRKRLLLAFCVFHRTAKQVFEEIFCSDTTQVSYRWLQYLRHKLLHASCDEKIEYLTKRKLRRNFVKIGRKMLLEPHHDILLAQLVETHNTTGSLINSFQFCSEERLVLRFREYLGNRLLLQEPGSI